MIKSYLKTALRNLKKNKLYSFINIAGLSVGISCCLLILLYIKYELSFDRFNKKADRVFRLTEILHLPNEDNARAVTSPPMAPLLKQSLPEVISTVRISFSQRPLSYKDTKNFDVTTIYADSTLFDIFSFNVVEGNSRTALVNPYSVVLTESAEKKFFGNEPALGKKMKLSDTINFTVTAIIKDIPFNAHFKFDCALSRSTLSEMFGPNPETNWFNNGFYTYLLLRAHTDYKKFESKINSTIGAAMVDVRKGSGLWYDFKLQPLTDIHLYSKLNSEAGANGDISYIYIFAAAAILILLIACSNYVNLSTARSINRSKEIGLRKAIGAQRQQLVVQFFGESFLFSVIGGVLAIAMVALALPSFSTFTGKPLHLENLFDPVFMVAYCAIIILVGLLSGAYPALQLSSFNSVRALKGNIKHGWQDILLRKGLVIFQFTIAVILLAGTGLIFEQLRFLQNQKLGMNKEQMMEIQIKNRDFPNIPALFDELKKNPDVSDVTVTDFSFKDVPNSIVVLPEGSQANQITSQRTISVDENFLTAFHIPLVAGRNFSRSHPTDPNEAFIVNEAAVQVFGWKTAADAVGKSIDWGLGKKGKVIGVVKNFNFSSLHDNIRPLVIHIYPEWYKYVAIRIKPGNSLSSIAAIQKAHRRILGDSPFEYTFMDDDFNNLYKSEKNMQSVLGLFTIFSVFVSCLGLFGLVVFSVQQRVKEIGVRKVLGASAGNIVGLLSKDFLKLVVIAAVIGTFVTYVAIDKWLQGFAYHVSISWWMFVIAGSIALVVAFITILFQAMKAALTNPVKSLRTE